MDEERSGNVDVVVEIIHCLIDCNLKHAYKKLLAAGWGLLIGGGVLLFVGGTPLKGGSLSELPKTAFFNYIVIRNRSFGGCDFFQFWRLEIARLQKYIILARWMRKDQAMLM